MNPVTGKGMKSTLANGQSLRLPGSDRSVELHNQLFRYAEDLQQMIERNEKLKSNYQQLLESSEQLLKTREMMNSLMQISKDILIMTDQEGVILQVNPSSEVIEKCDRLVGGRLVEFVMQSHRQQFLKMLEIARDADLGAAKESEQELHIKSNRNNAGMMIVTCRVSRVGESKDSTFYWLIQDITSLREREFESRISSVVLNNANEGVMITDIDGEIRAINPAFTRITGYSAEEAIGRNPRFLQSGMQTMHFYQNFWKSLEVSGTWQGMIHNRTKEGRNYPQWLCVNSVKDETGSVLSYIGVFSDMSEMQKAENDLSYLAYYDTLTGLPNRLLLQDRSRQIMSQARRSKGNFTLIFIDMDGFKEINDQHGHDVGDLVLREFATRMNASVREIDTVARLGGDEFVILSPGLYGDAAITRVCEKLIAAIQQPMKFDGIDFTIGVSMGCAEYPRHGEDEFVLMKHADIAMYQAKKMGGNTSVIYKIDHSSHHVK